MVFKRRDQRPIFRILAEWIYPRGGWTRAFHYVRHRLNRLPGSAESIARGIAAGVFTVYTPFFGLHFLAAAILAIALRGNILAALLATFVGNPLTYLPIAIISLEVGHFLLGSTMRGAVDESIFHLFKGALGDLWHNFVAIFDGSAAQWGELHNFYDTIFLPWMVGSIPPGILSAVIAYGLSVPVIRAYQKRRIARLLARRKKRAAQQQAGHMGGER